MRKFDDNEYFLFKALSQNVISDVSPALEKVSKQSSKWADEIDAVEKKLEEAESGVEINELSKLSNEKRKGLIRLLAIKNRMDTLLKKNQERVAYINNILKNAGIYNEAFDRKIIAEIEKQEAENISSESLNLNPLKADGIEYQDVFFQGAVLRLKNGKLDFSVPENSSILQIANDEFVSAMITSFPDSVATISVETLANTAVKKRVLKALATFVVDEAKKKDIKQINKTLGNLLEFKTQITTKPEDYVAGVSNMFNVQVKTYLMQIKPAQKAQINDKLKCNEKSELIPESKRIAVLAAGVAGDIAPENEESEEERIAREKTMGANSANEFFANLERQLKTAEEQEIKAQEDMRQLQQKEAEEIKKKEAESKKEEEQPEEEQEQMYRVMSNNKYDD